MEKFGYLVTLIENQGIRVKSARWEEDGSLNIDVDEADEERAGAILQEYWRQDWEHDHIGLIAIPNGSDNA